MLAVIPSPKPTITQKPVPSFVSSQVPKIPGSTISSATVVILVTHSMATAIGGGFSRGSGFGGGSGIKQILL
jgi:hypothetical protein